MDEIIKVSKQWDLTFLIQKILISNASNPLVLTPSKVFLILNKVEMTPEFKSVLLRCV